MINTYCNFVNFKVKKVLRKWKRKNRTISGKDSVIKSLVSSMITLILLSLPNPSREYIEQYNNMII